jgi:AcrR family transcriptional regulator
MAQQRQDEGALVLHPCPARRDAVEHQRQILDAARRLFGERGVEAVSMHQIAQIAGVGQGTLYRRYAHKGELCLDLLRESVEHLLDEIAVLRAADDLPPLERLDDVLACLAAFVEEKAPLLGAIDDAASGERRDTKFRNPVYRCMHETITALLTEADATLSPLDASFTADALLAALSPDVYLFERRERGLTAEQILQQVRRIYIAGLVSGGPRR